MHALASCMGCFLCMYILAIVVLPSCVNFKAPGDEMFLVPHQFILPMLLKIVDDGVFLDETTSAPVLHIQLTSPTSSNVPDQKRL